MADSNKKETEDNIETVEIKNENEGAENNINTVEEETVDDRVDQLFGKVGGCGLFQVFAYIVIVFGISGPSFFIFAIGFFTQKPDAYVCTYTGDVEPTENICTLDNICAGDSQIASWEADPDSIRTLDNWQQKLDLTCADSWKVSMIGTSLFLGWALTLLWLPGFADKMGRKKVFLVGMIVDLGLYTGLMFTYSLEVMIVLYFLFGMMSSIRISVGYVYMVEMMPKKAQTHVTSVWSVTEALVYLIATIWFWQVSKNWFWYCFIGYVWQMISVLGLFWMPESPRWLVSVGKLDEARKAFTTIARWNRKVLDWDESKYAKDGKVEKRSALKCSQETEGQV
jgi:MFS family permease